MLVKLALGEISLNKLAAAFQMADKSEEQKSFEFINRKDSSQVAGFIIEGVGRLLTNIAACCNPLPGDPIIGFITKGRGVSIHRQDCPNVLRLTEKEPDKILAVNWSRENKAAYQVNILVEAYDRPDLLKDLTGLFANEKITINALNSYIEPEDNINKIKIGIEIRNLQQLSKILHKLEQFKNVIAASRV